MAPTHLGGWGVAIIEDLLTKGYYEAESFDFKETLPDRRNESDKLRLAKSCCAFANSAGGFLVFGVRDGRSLPVEQRLVGVDPTTDFFEHFGNYPAKCAPSVGWDFRKPSIALDSGRVIQVVQIPRSWTAPHWVEDARGGKHFLKRTNKGNEAMSYEEVRMAFLHYYEKRLKLQLLRAELQSIRETAQTFIIPEGGTSPLSHDVGELGLAVIEAVLADTYTILADRPALLSRLAGIRRMCRMVNSKAVRFYQSMSGAPRGAGDTQAAIGRHNIHMRLWSQTIEYDCDHAIQMLDEILDS